MLAPMRYKTFTWPNNPRTYSISYERQTAVHKIPLGAYAMEDLGRTCRVMRGEGEFYGPDAYANFKKLASVFYEGGAGNLFHPVWMTTSAHFTQLQLRQEPRKDYVAYSFTFLEDFPQTARMQQLDPNAPAGTVYRIVSAGETLWSIASSCGKTVKELLALNPHISNLNNLRAGEKVRVR